MRKETDSVVVRLQSKYPHAVTINDYLTKMKNGLAPRPETVRGASWVTKYNTRTFGFATEAERDIFIEQWSPE